MAWSKNIELGVQGQSWPGQSRISGRSGRRPLGKAGKSNPVFICVDEPSVATREPLTLSSEVYSFHVRMISHKLAVRLLMVDDGLTRRVEEHEPDPTD